MQQAAGLNVCFSFTVSLVMCSRPVRHLGLLKRRPFLPPGERA